MDRMRIGLVGYGEVGKTFAVGLKPQVAQSSAWDLKFAQQDNAAEQQRHAREHGVHPCASMQELCEASELVISAVTASNTLAVAQEAARFLRPGTVFLDLNSACPAPSRRRPPRSRRTARTTWKRA